MGRQAHLTAVALGRSPYGPPLRDDNGNLVLGPHTHDDDASGYVQQFDDRGHPRSQDSDMQNRRLRRAQNEILKLAGVVRSKHDPPEVDEWKGLSDDDRKQLFVEENDYIKAIRFFDHVFLDLSTSWVDAFRFRLMTFQSYLGPPVFSMLRCEWRILSLRDTLYSGLPLSITTRVSRRWRARLFAEPYHRCSLLSIRSKYRQLSGNKFQRLLRHFWDLLFFGIEWPFKVASSLQMLHILPTTAVLDLRIVFSIYSVLFVENIPTVPESFSFAEIPGFLLQCLSHPFVIAYLFDQIRESLESGIRAILRHRLPVPDEPDALSNKYMPIWDLDDHVRAQMPGFGYDVDAKRSYFGPQNLSEAFRMAFPFASRVFYALTGYPAVLRAHLNPENEVQLKQLCELRYGSLWRKNHHLTETQQLPDSVIRRRAVEDTFSRAGINPSLDSISLETWTRNIPDRSQSTSTATPDPQDMFPNVEGNGNGETAEATAFNLTDQSPREPIPAAHPIAGQATHEAGANNDDTEPIFEGSPATADQVDSTTPGEELSVESTGIMPVEIGVTTPSPGITRATSLDQALPRPVRRPTEIDGAFDADFFSLPNRPIQALAMMEELLGEPGEPERHRVTLLSNLPTEVVAIHGSALITSVLMFPYDMFYHRMLARTFLSLGPQRLMRRQIMDDVLASPSLLSMDSTAIRRGAMLVWNLGVSFGIQAGISTFICRAVQWMVLSLSEEFGWGKI